MSGSIHRRPQGWWFVRLYHQRKYYTFSWYHNGRMWDERDARKLLSQIQGDIERGTFNPLRYTKGQSPVSAYLIEWYELNESRWSPATRQTYKVYIDKHLEPYFKDSRIVIQEVRKQVLDKLRIHLTGSVSGQTAFSIINGCLKSCVRYAWENEIIDHMPPFPHRRDYGINRQQVKVVTPQVQREIIEAIPQEHRPLFWWLALHCRRPSEAIALHKSDYDPVRQVFVLRHGQSARKNVDHIKTRDEHEMPCHGQMVQILAAMKHEHPFSPYLFTCRSARNRDKQYTKDIIAKLWSDACKKVGVSISLYQGTKHSTAQAYLDAGYSMEQVMAVTGHKSMGSVKHYAHATIENRRALMDRRVVPIRKVEEG